MPRKNGIYVLILLAIDKSEFVDIFLLEHSVETVVLIIRQ